MAPLGWLLAVCLLCPLDAARVPAAHLLPLGGVRRGGEHGEGRDGTQQLLLSSGQAAPGATITRLGWENVAAPRGKATSKCSLCTETMSDALSDLLNIILGRTLVKSCSGLCGHLNGTITAACTLVCDMVGIKVFEEAVEQADLDPIYYCQLISMCQVAPGGKVALGGIDIVPGQGPAGALFAVTASGRVDSPTSSGEIVLDILPAGKEIVDAVATAREVTPGLPTGPWTMTWTLGGGVLPGEYRARVRLCGGECGSKHPHAEVYAEAEAPLTVTATTTLQPT